MRIALVTCDNRDEDRRYSEPIPYFGQAVTALLQGFELMPDCEVHVVSATHEPVQAPARIAENIYYHSVLVPKSGWLRGIYIGCIRAVRKKLLEIRPDIVHGQGTERYCAISAVFSGFPNVLTIHGNMRAIARINKVRPFSFLWLAASLERFTLPRTFGIFCNSDYTFKQVSALAPVTWKIPNAVRTVFFSPSSAVKFDYPPMLLNIGNISPRKAQNELLDLAACLRRNGAQFRLGFVGRADSDSEYSSRFLARVAEVQKHGYVEYLGEKSESELVEVMDRASALIHFAREEAFGLVVAEGLARNLKLFATRVGGVVEIAGRVEGADLIEVGNQAGFEAAVIKWLGAGGLKLKDAATQMEGLYHPKVIAARHLEIYREVLDPGKTKRGKP